MTTGLYLTFRASGHRYGIPVDVVLEAARLRTLVPLPGAPRACAGVTLVRGEPRGVLDVAKAMGEGSVERSGALLIALEGRSSALLVDRIDGVEPIDGGSVVAPEVSGVSRGRVSLGGSWLTLLDVDALLRKRDETTEPGGLTGGFRPDQQGEAHV